MRVIKSRRIKWVGHVACMVEERGVYGVLVGKPEGKKPMGRHRRRWVGNIRMDLQEAKKPMGRHRRRWVGNIRMDLQEV